MRTISVAALTALGLALAGVSPSAAAPAHGIAIRHAAQVTKVVDHVRWWRAWGETLPPDLWITSSRLPFSRRRPGVAASSRIPLKADAIPAARRTRAPFFAPGESGASPSCLEPAGALGPKRASKV